MSIAIGSPAPDFNLTTATAEGPKKIRLSDYAGQSNVVLFFFPMAFTGTCTDEFCTLSRTNSEYGSLNAVVLGVSGDNPFAQAAWAAKEGISIPLLADYEHDVAKAYGVAYETFVPAIHLDMGGVAKRSVFIVDKAGLVQYVEIHEDARELPDFEAIKAALAKLA